MFQNVRATSGAQAPTNEKPATAENAPKPQVSGPTMQRAGSGSAAGSGDRLERVGATVRSALKATIDGFVAYAGIEAELIRQAAGLDHPEQPSTTKK